MYLKQSLRRKLIAAGLALIALPFSAMAAQNDGSAAKPRARDSRTRRRRHGGWHQEGLSTHLHGDRRIDGVSSSTSKVGQSYGSVVEAMCNGAADIAWYGPVTYLQAKGRGCSELLALAVNKGQSVYYSGVFARTDAAIDGVADLKGKKVALGDVNSTSSFAVPVAMMMAGGVEPARDLASINMAGSHANVLKALAEGLVDAGGASFDSFEKAVNGNAIDPSKVKVIAKSAPIPYPPLAIHPKVEGDVKAKLRDAFNNIDKLPGITKEQIRGYGGGKVDGYTANVSEDDMAAAGKMFELVTDQVKQDIMKKASAR